MKIKVFVLIGVPDSETRNISRVEDSFFEENGCMQLL